VKTDISVSKEDYLKAILEAESEGQTVISATLAHWLEVSPPAVSMALRRLRRDGYVDVKSDGVVRLTPKGHETAYRTALRHHLIERMLSEMFGMPWYEVHGEAERLEHAVSPAFESLLMKKLGEKGTCPHGNAVLPESPDKRKKRGVRSLAEVPVEAQYTVTSMYERDPGLLMFLQLRPDRRHRDLRWPVHHRPGSGGESPGSAVNGVWTWPKSCPSLIPHRPVHPTLQTKERAFRAAM